MRNAIITGLLLFGSFEGFSQTDHLSLNADNSKLFVRIENEQLNYLDSLYINKTGVGRDFINGRAYKRYFYLSEHIPILFHEKERTASLNYKGRTYNSIVLQYDTYLDKVIYDDNSITSNTMMSQVALNSDNISQFVLYFDHDTLTFRYFSDRLYPGFNLEDGFYESVYDGRCKYLVKHKSRRNKNNGIDEYYYNPIGYVRVGDRFVRVASFKQFVSLFGNASRDIRKYIAEKRIRIRRADKFQITEILRFYESIEANSR
jgi:hypothetical protein